MSLRPWPERRQLRRASKRKEAVFPEVRTAALTARAGHTTALPTARTRFPAGKCENTLKLPRNREKSKACLAPGRMEETAKQPNGADARWEAVAIEG